MSLLTAAITARNTRSAILRRFDRRPGFLTSPDLTLRAALSRHSPSSPMRAQLY